MLKAAGAFGVLGALMGAAGLVLFISTFVSLGLLDADPALNPVPGLDSHEEFGRKMRDRDAAEGRIFIRAPIGMGLMAFGSFIVFGAGTIGAAGGAMRLAKRAKRDADAATSALKVTCAFCGASGAAGAPCPACGARQS